MSAPRDSGERVHQAGDFSWMNEVPGRKTFWQRAREDPLVPLGCAVTVAVLAGGLVTFQRGQSKLGNKFMQARVVAQTGTVLAMGAGGAVAATRKEDTKKQSYEERMKIELRE
ncbi:hypothetical protein PybrP1_012602 [[Pythium] brassicae (nom. inval.)]|nr:hypothetical protein PybrP1_012602 [[Pythium] brassicae (nom. inval.)]